MGFIPEVGGVTGGVWVPGRRGPQSSWVFCPPGQEVLFHIKEGNRGDGTFYPAGRKTRQGLAPEDRASTGEIFGNFPCGKNPNIPQTLGMTQTSGPKLLAASVSFEAGFIPGPRERTKSLVLDLVQKPYTLKLGFLISTGPDIAPLVLFTSATGGSPRSKPRICS